uniref:Uncharacterized protein n=1 Tax=Arundo donax TaxID=35708 RepID=A0A0A9G652_ARUDO
MLNSFKYCSPPPPPAPLFLFIYSRLTACRIR